MNCSDGAIKFKSYFDKTDYKIEQLSGPLDLSDQAIRNAYPFLEKNDFIPIYRNLLEQLPLIISCIEREQNQALPQIAYMYNQFNYQIKNNISFASFESFLKDTVKAIVPRFSPQDLLIQGELDKVLHSIPLLLNHADPSAACDAPLIVPATTHDEAPSSAPPLAAPASLHLSESEKPAKKPEAKKSEAKKSEAKNRRVKQSTTEMRRQLFKDRVEQVLAKNLPSIIQTIEKLENSPRYRPLNLNESYLQFKKMELKIKITKQNFKDFLANKIKESGIKTDPLSLHRDRRLAKALNEVAMNSLLLPQESTIEKNAASAKVSRASLLRQNKEILIQIIEEIEGQLPILSPMTVILNHFNALTGLNIEKGELRCFLKELVSYHFPECSHCTSTLINSRKLASKLKSIADW